MVTQDQNPAFDGGFPEGPKLNMNPVIAHKFSNREWGYWNHLLNGELV